VRVLSPAGAPNVDEQSLVERPFQAAKAALRAHVRAALRGLSPDARRLASRSLCERLAALDGWRNARTVMGFVPLADEPDILPALHAGMASGARVALVRADWKSGSMDAAVVDNLDADLVEAGPGVRQPRADLPAADLASIEWALVPGVAFDARGNRLGRGGGFYDRFLAFARRPGCTLAGACFDEQLVDTVPADRQDLRVDVVITPSRAIAVNAG